MAERIPAECCPLGHFLEEEMNARHWTSREVALRMGGANLREIAIDQLVVDMTIHVHDVNLLLDADTARKLGRAFDVSPEYFVNLDRAWRKWKIAQPDSAEGGTDA